MSKYRFFPLLLTAVLLLLTHAASAQRMVLFESFTNEADPIITGTDTRAQFNSDVDDVASSKRNKAIHFNHHVGNESDILEIGNSSILGGRMFPAGAGHY